MNAGTEPLIYTSLGNMPLSVLEERVSWNFVRGAAGEMAEATCTVEHWHKGACVKRACHVYMAKGPATEGIVGNVGG